MKRERINVGKVGLVFKKGNYERVLTQGNYWLNFGESCIQYDLTTSFTAPVALDIVLQDEKLREMLHVIEVKDNEIVLMYENGNFKNVLAAGRYTFWNTLIQYEFTRVDISKIYITEKIDKSLFSNYALAKYIRAFEVASHEKAVLLVDDVYTKTLEGGIYRFWRNETSIKIAKVDLRQLQLEIAGQELLTKDKAAIRVNFYTCLLYTSPSPRDA